MSSLTPSFISSIRNAMLTSDQHFAVVENTPRLLDMLNQSDRLSKLLNRRDSRGYTFLHCAAERNQPESLKCLLIKEGEMGMVWRGGRGEGFLNSYFPLLSPSPSSLLSPLLPPLPLPPSQS